MATLRNNFSLSPAPLFLFPPFFFFLLSSRLLSFNILFLQLVQNLHPFSSRCGLLFIQFQFWPRLHSPEAASGGWLRRQAGIGQAAVVREADRERHRQDREGRGPGLPSHGLPGILGNHSVPGVAACVWDEQSSNGEFTHVCSVPLYVRKGGKVMERGRDGDEGLNCVWREIINQKGCARSKGKRVIHHVRYT